ncbi:hypothetical protein KEJ37_00275 [Candidatus Bathyarchaeota archaeon]|nr:hypothetical protein [Candidatus Bathyarchaeota archaeon]
MSLKLLKNLFRLKCGGLAIFATVYEIMDHEWADGKLACPHEGCKLTIQQHINGKLVGELKIKTCAACDPGA